MLQDRFSYPLAFLGGIGFGGLIAPVAVLLPLLCQGGIDSQGSLFFVYLAVMIYAFSLPVWVIGLLLIGLPVYWGVRRAGGRGYLPAVATGTLIVGSIWFVAALVLVDDLQTDATPIQAMLSIVGAVSGGVAGAMGWWLGSRGCGSGTAP